MRPPAASTNRLAFVAMPDKCCKKLRAVRSPISSVLPRPTTSPIVSPAAIRLAVFFLQRGLDSRLDLAESLDRHFEAGNHACGLRQEDAAGSLVGANRGTGCHVAPADVFGERAPDDVAILLRSAGGASYRRPQTRVAPLRSIRIAGREART